MALFSALAVTKRFPGVLALDGVDFTLERGDVHCLVGENGAGKSTLIKIFSGAHEPDEGTLELDGRPVRFPSPFHALHAGIATIFQESNLVPELTVAENILLGREPQKRSLPLLDRTEMRSLAERALATVNESIDSGLPARELSPAQHQMVEIAKAISRDARIVILDEPTAALTERETRNLFSVIRRLSAEGMSFIYISHRLEEIFEIGTRITVLRDGRVVARTTPAETTQGSLVMNMVGRDIAESSTQYAVSSREKALLRVSRLTSRYVHDCSFVLHEGEILGFAGLAGSGRTELARCLFGADERVSGEVTLKDKPFLPVSPREALESGLGLLTEDRNRLGLFPERSVMENITVSRLRELSSGLFLQKSRETDSASSLAKQLRIKTPSLGTAVSTLSGGNKQKVLLARIIGLRPRVIIFDEPTAGIDVGAKQEIHELIRELAQTGTSVILISSELPELLALCSRICVMRNRTIAGEIARSEASEERILHIATGTTV